MAEDTAGLCPDMPEDPVPIQEPGEHLLETVNAFYGRSVVEMLDAEAALRSASGLSPCCGAEIEVGCAFCGNGCQLAPTQCNYCHEYKGCERRCSLCLEPVEDLI